MKLEIRMTESSEYPNLAPPARSVAQLPGSMYPTATSRPGPANASIFFHGPAPCGTGTEACTSGKDGTWLCDRQPGAGVAEAALSSSPVRMRGSVCSVGYISIGYMRRQP